MGNCVSLRFNFNTQSLCERVRDYWAKIMEQQNGTTESAAIVESVVMYNTSQILSCELTSASSWVWQYYLDMYCLYGVFLLIGLALVQLVWFVLLWIWHITTTAKTKFKKDDSRRESERSHRRRSRIVSNTSYS